MYDIEISEDIFERYYGNLTQYIPDFLIEIKEISSVYRAQSKELARFNLEIQDVLNQFNIDTATWGLILHEIKYGIEFNPSLSLEERRHRIKGAKRGRGTSDTYMLKNTSEAFGKCEAYIDRHDSDYYFNLLLSSYNGFSKSFDYLYKIIDEISPAHLRVNYKLISKTKSRVFVGATCISGRKVTVYPWKTKKLSSKGKVSIAGPIIKGSHHIRVYPKKEKE